MLKKYKTFLESVGDVFDCELNLSITDLNSDREFNKDIYLQKCFIDIDLLHSDYHSLMIRGVKERGEELTKYMKQLEKLTNGIFMYFRRVINKNDFKFKKCCFYKENKQYYLKIRGDIDDLLKINKYFGLSDDNVSLRGTQNILVISGNWFSYNSIMGKF